MTGEIIKSGMHARFVTTKERGDILLHGIFKERAGKEREFQEISNIMSHEKSIIIRTKRNVLNLVEHKFD